MFMKRAAVAVMMLGVLMGAAATQPATKPAAWPLERAIEGIPANLFPKPNDSTLKQQSRAKWLQDNVYGKRQGPWNMSGTLHDVRSVRVDGVDRIQVTLNSAEMYFGERRVCVITAMMDESTDPNEAMDWKGGSTITLHGGVIFSGSENNIGEPSTDIRMVDAVFVAPTTKPATTKPRGAPTPPTRRGAPRGR